MQELSEGPHALTVPLHRVKRDDRVLVHEAGVKVVPAPRKDPVSVFGFMSSEVSAERPKELTVAAVAEGMIDTRRRGSGSSSSAARRSFTPAPAATSKR